MNKEELIARAQELDVQVPEGATNKDIETLIKVAEHPILKDALKSLDVSYAEAKEENAALTAKVEALTEAVKAQQGPTVKVGKDVYEFKVANFRFKGEQYTAKEAVKNAALIEKLIEAKFINLEKQ